MSQTWLSILSAGGGILGAVLTLVGVRLSQRQSNKQLQVTADIERDKVNAAAYTEGRQVWAEMVKDLQVERTAQKNQISDLQVKVEAQDAESHRWRQRLEDMEQKRSGDRYAIHLISTYARRLLRTIEDGGLVPPQPPEGLDLTG